ncbi:FolD protein [Bartonella bacilliformis str. Heidi Mejia]|uniref:Bifunctional protein FolD n=2 Tax=Bartonella bacilliformis TaxID=774 RepID=FOLD_BARBK|nr:bifunctional methylenetetrahydrofolate dehydrogenase/methenyltetrahydrofolate cyclohydrolase FolD [Bartonella bacilliformis]A1URL6.1 RecName: Full=Bifunctional protein FolD; Includes: RecName: Full=Methylenetetrahydrofolate dehydrogenase; Includes: RecName: Full=Methenyltetrahydrofolate cyclohydrolase [Bartonella bacilliformis KC583]ABM44510.1 folD bifunctional protein [Bartonella bacilliformis KC583]AMG85472.1 bifunctional methylenetetrahydrofolate dehydrogenase/methenyltetrahydrofolate cycl
MDNIIDGKKLAENVIAKVKNETEKLKNSHNIQPGIAVIIVGDDPASQVYVASKSKKAEECGFFSMKHVLPKEVEESELLQLIEILNSDPKIHGILVQLPLPAHINTDRATQAIAVEKDVDGFHYINIGKLAANAIKDAIIPCTPAGAMMMIEQQCGQDLSGLNAVIVGRSNIVGKPMAALLTAANATVTLAHSRTRDLDEICRRADILIAAVGRPQMIKKHWVKKGAIVIDVGINRIAAPEKGPGKTRLVGDVDFEEVKGKTLAITPVPGGVGPMTIAMLMVNTLKAAARSLKLPVPKF